MIIRQIIRRQGRSLLIVPSAARARLFSSDADALESFLQNNLQETHSVESSLQDVTSSFVPAIDDDSHSTINSNADPMVSRHQILQRQRKTTGQLGTYMAPHYQPHMLLTNPPSPSDITLELLLASQSHLGHSTSLWNPMNSRYIFGIRQGIHIISLDVTASHLRRACRVVSGVAEKGGLILFVGTRPGQSRCVVKAAELASGCHLYERWIPGSITNGQQILGRSKLKMLNQEDKEIQGMGKRLKDISALKPDLVVCLNPLENWVLLHECGLYNIPTIGIIDTDADPTWVTYPVPANDDSLRCVQVIAGVLGRAGEEGQAKRMALAKAGTVTCTPTKLEDDGTREALAGA